ncbi:MAG TPA: 1-deoxy-D-xylulose-5-phosphate reductoisomerase, partial [Nitrosomonas nitrosa]|nr:1-deoxy-D-xylulose-5-phosphate reductoisomerase [Nitrosomonas nitrosa]
AANEIAVESFLAGKMPFTAIPAMIEQVMQRISRNEVNTLEDVIAADTLARETARDWLMACQV